RDTIVPVSTRMLVANGERVDRMSDGMFALMPIPMTTRPSRLLPFSIRMPANFRPSTWTSLGHLIEVRMPATVSMAYATATEAINSFTLKKKGAPRKALPRYRFLDVPHACTWRAVEVCQETATSVQDVPLTK